MFYTVAHRQRRREIECKIREGETERIEIKKKLKKLKRGRDRW